MNICFHLLLGLRLHESVISSKIFLQDQLLPVSVAFSGGLGAQIISTAVYCYFSEGFDVVADFSYFKQKSFTNSGRSDEGLSIFPCSLIPLESSERTFGQLVTTRYHEISDGYIKTALFLRV